VNPAYTDTDPRQSRRAGPVESSGAASQRWLQDAKLNVTLRIVVNELGLRWARQDERLMECPSCFATKPTASKRNYGPVCVWMDDGRWYCTACELVGDALDLVCLVEWRKKFEAGDRELSTNLRRWCAARNLCQSAEGEQLERVALREMPKVKPRPVVPQVQILALWERCDTVLSDDVVEWLRSRHVDPCLVEDKRLARALPPGVPGWARRWLELEAHCVLPLWGADGTLVSLQARRCVPQGEIPKAMAPEGAPSGVLADLTGQCMLRGEARPGVHEEQPASPLPEAPLLPVFITEGDVDFLLRATWVGESEDAPAVFGVPGGDAWPPWLASRIPPGSPVYVDVHRDDKGEALLQRVIRDLGPTCPIRRIDPMRGAP
jgi:hypothetical protein